MSAFPLRSRASVHLQGHLRYTPVGEVATDDSNTFDDDILVGVTGRWYFRSNMALVTGYEYGKITTWNLGLRFLFKKIGRVAPECRTAPAYPGAASLRRSPAR